jgi:hypothetical protein|tara:strand:+ start:665 stop:982 length:318 start_codon:yes stop_codon:yes gene_type:complete
MGMSAPSFDSSGQQAMMQANLEREREYRKQDAAEAQQMRLEEEKLRMSLEKAFRDEQYAQMQAEEEAIDLREEAAMQENLGQSEMRQNVMDFFSDRPGVQIKDSM